MNAVETVNYRGFEIRIFQDEDAISPGDMDNDTAFLVHYHRNCWIDNKAMPEALLQDWYEAGGPEQMTGADGKQYWIFAVAAYIHSGTVLSLAKSFPGDSGGWDTSHVGAVCINIEEIPHRGPAGLIAEGLVAEWNQYLGGEVYGYKVEGIEEASCWGFYGNWEDEDESCLLQEAKEAIDWHIKEKQAKHCKRLKAWIRAGVPLQYRKQFSCGV